MRMAEEGAEGGEKTKTMAGEKRQEGVNGGKQTDGLIRIDRKRDRYHCEEHGHPSLIEAMIREVDVS